MRVLVVGAGAIGSLVGGYLAVSGHDVTLVGRPNYVAAVREHGLVVKQQEKGIPLVTRPQAVAAVEEIDERSFDLVLITTKAYDTAVAARQVKPILTPSTVVLVLQNGVGGEEIALNILGSALILSAVVTLAVTVDAPGCVSLTTKKGGLTFAPVHAQAPVVKIVGMFSAAGLRTAVCIDYRGVKWSKLLLNLLANAIPAILDMKPEEVYADPRLFALERAAFREALNVMAALGLRPVNLVGYPVRLFAYAMQHFPQPVLQPALRYIVAEGRGGKPPSLHLDLIRGKAESEVDFLNGAVVQAGAKVGIPAPVNQLIHNTLSDIVQRKSLWQTFRRRPEALLTLLGQRCS